MEVTKQVTREHLIEPKFLHANSMISDSVIGPIISSDFVTDVAAAHLFLPALLIIS